MTDLTTVRPAAALAQCVAMNHAVDGIHPRAWIPKLLPARHRKPPQILASWQPASQGAHLHRAPSWLH